MIPLGSFTLDTSTLAGAAFVSRFLQTETGGEFRDIQYQVSDNINNSDLEVHSIAAGITIGSDSTENQ